MWTRHDYAQTREGVTMNASDREVQQYLFDLQGYLVIPDVLSAAEVAELKKTCTRGHKKGPQADRIVRQRAEKEAWHTV